MAYVLAGLILLLPTLVTAVLRVVALRGRRRESRAAGYEPVRPTAAGRHAAGAPAAGAAPQLTETAALQLLLRGAVSKAEYRYWVETLAAYDEIANPVRVPLG